MTQEERWLERFMLVVDFIETNKRNPSKHRIEEHNMLNWVKANRKVMNAGKMKPGEGGEVQGTSILSGAISEKEPV